MTPLPPPKDHPVPIPSPEDPPPVDIEITEFQDMKTFVDRRCQGCAGEILLLDDDVQPPDSYAEAYRPPVRCRGTRDSRKWWFCKQPVFDDLGVLRVAGAEGYLEIPGKLGVQFFPERRASKILWEEPDRRSA